MKLKQEMLLIPAQSVINGFCWAYSKALLEKLKELRADDSLFDQFGQMSSPVGDSVSYSLCVQIHFRNIGRGAKSSEIDQLISVAEEYLAIFEKK